MPSSRSAKPADSFAHGEISIGAHLKNSKAQGENAPALEIAPANVRRVAETEFHHQGQVCAIDQRIANTGEKPASRVAVQFSFEDAIGRIIGSESEAAIAAKLPAGAAKQFTFRVPCPRSLALVKVRILPGQKGQDEPKLALLPPVRSDASPLGEDFSELALPVPQRSVCPFPNPCKLSVHFDGGGTSMFEFHRDPDARDLLVASDSLLTAHFRRHGTGSLLIPSRSGEVSILIRDGNLRRPSAASLLDRISAMFRQEEARQ